MKFSKDPIYPPFIIFQLQICGVKQRSLIKLYRVFFERNQHYGTPNKGRDCVFVLNETVARLRPVKVGISDGKNIEVIHGLKEGEDVLTEGHYGMQDNTTVVVAGK